jgi:hypothetical protein
MWREYLEVMLKYFSVDGEAILKYGSVNLYVMFRRLDCVSALNQKPFPTVSGTQLSLSPHSRLALSDVHLIRSLSEDGDIFQFPKRCPQLR